MRRGSAIQTFSLHPYVMGPAIGVLALFLPAYVGATAYLVYRDDLVGAAVSRQVSMQYAYEERIAALRSELDRLTSRHAVQSQGVEQQLSTLLEQQTTIEERQSTLDALLRRVGVDVGAATRVPKARPDSDAPSEEGPADSDGSIAPLSYLPNERSSGQDAIGNLLRSRPEQATPKLSSNMRPTLERVRGSLASTEAELSQALDFLGAAAEDKAERISEALARIGVGDPEDNQQGEGGPFVPTAGLHFVEKTALLTHTLDDLEALRRTAAQMPLAMPVRATHVSSGFGVRRDPFLNRPAFHSGVDFVAEAGSTVRATAPGIVVEAGWSGGYGEMVEIRHANGVSTRYGHLSEILVTVGAKVAAGAPIGRVGSTGRSTGPHLHYETRRDGNAVNPALYLAAGRAVRDPT